MKQIETVFTQLLEINLIYYEYMHKHFTQSLFINLLCLKYSVSGAEGDFTIFSQSC